MANRKKPQPAPVVKNRGQDFAARASTRIWEERPDPHNPYIADTCRCHGYDLFELMEKRGFVDVVYLLFREELPGPRQRRLFEALMIALINPGPRHPATRAAINAGIGKTDVAHILPISLAIMGGTRSGGGSVAQAMRFLRTNRNRDPEELAQELLAASQPPDEGDWHIAPGFGSRFGSIDLVPQQLAERFAELSASGSMVLWGRRFVAALKDSGMGWLYTGIAAAVLADLKFRARESAGLFGLLSAPGLLAHGLEAARKPISAMPFLDEEHYVIES